MHIGKLIKEKVKEQNKTSVWLAQQMSYSRTNIYKLYDKKSIDTDVLFRISAILDFDFFSLYTKHMQNRDCPMGQERMGIVPWDKNEWGLSLISLHANQSGTILFLPSPSIYFLCKQDN